MLIISRSYLPSWLWWDSNWGLLLCLYWCSHWHHLRPPSWSTLRTQNGFDFEVTVSIKVTLIYIRVNQYIFWSLNSIKIITGINHILFSTKCAKKKSQYLAISKNNQTLWHQHYKKFLNQLSRKKWQCKRCWRHSCSDVERCCQWKESITDSLSGDGGMKELCNTFQVFTLLLIARKILARILINTLVTQISEYHLSENQCDFRTKW